MIRPNGPPSPMQEQEGGGRRLHEPTQSAKKWELLAVAVVEVVVMVVEVTTVDLAVAVAIVAVGKQFRNIRI